MAKSVSHPDSVTVSLGGRSFAVPRLTLGHIRRLMKLWGDFGKIKEPDSEALFDHGVATAELIFERADPPIGDLDDLACSPQELRAASRAVLEFSGLAAKAAESGAASGEAESKGRP